MAEIWMIWMLVATFVYYTVFTVTNTIAALQKQNETNYTKFVAKLLIITVFVETSLIMIHQAIIGDIHFFDIFLESGLKTIFYLLIISAPLHLVIFRKNISENIKKATTNISYN